jgi:hypothetical protein
MKARLDNLARKVEALTLMRRGTNSANQVDNGVSVCSSPMHTSE